MKYSAEDIVHQTFERKFRGYDPEQVHEFLQSMAREWDYFASELTRMQDIVEEQTQELRELRHRERALVDTLNTAREVASDLERKANTRSASIIEEAQRRADQLVQSAQRQQARLIHETQELQRQRSRLDFELRSILNAHMRLLNEELAQSAAASDEQEQDAHSAPTMRAVSEPPGAAAASQGPVIHRRPRTKPPAPAAALQDEDDDDEWEDDEAEDASAHIVDVYDRETVAGLVPHVMHIRE